MTRPVRSSSCAHASNLSWDAFSQLTGSWKLSFLRSLFRGLDAIISVSNTRFRGVAGAAWSGFGKHFSCGSVVRDAEISKLFPHAITLDCVICHANAERKRVLAVQVRLVERTSALNLPELSSPRFVQESNLV